MHDHQIRRSRSARLPLTLALGALLLLGTGSAFAGENFNVTFWSNLDEYGGYSDIWGYTAPDGREYALLGATSGVSVINVTDRDNPYETGFVAGPFSGWRDIKTWGHFAYVTNEEAGGLAIIDLSDPENPVDLPSYTGFTTAHNLYVDEAAALVFIAGSDLPGVRILSPAPDGSVTEIAAWEDAYAHDVQGGNGVLFVSAIWDGTLYILDYSDPQNIATLGAINGYPSAFTHNAWATADNAYVMTTDELPGAPLRLWDVSALPAWSETDTYAPNGETIPHNAHIKGNLAFVSYYTLGVKVLDITDKSNILEAGAWDTFPANDNGNYNGSWGVFPFYPNSPGLMVASDMSTGLHVLEYAPTTGVEDSPAALPARLAQNSPNPFNPRTRIDLAARAGEGPQAAALAVFDMRGRRLVTLFEGVLADGERRSFVWDGRDDRGNALPSGVYLSHARFGAETESRKMLMLK